MDIIKAIIVFYPDVSVGIRYEEFSMDLPCYVHDEVEVEEISDQIRVIYEPFCETKMDLHFQCTDGSIMDEKGVKMIPSEIEY